MVFSTNYNDKTFKSSKSCFLLSKPSDIPHCSCWILQFTFEDLNFKRVSLPYRNLALITCHPFQLLKGQFWRTQAFTPGSSAKLWEFQSQKPRPMEIPLEFFLNSLEIPRVFQLTQLKFPHTLFSIPLESPVEEIPCPKPLKSTIFSVVANFLQFTRQTIVNSWKSWQVKNLYVDVSYWKTLFKHSFREVGCVFINIGFISGHLIRLIIVNYCFIVTC